MTHAFAERRLSSFAPTRIHGKQLKLTLLGFIATLAATGCTTSLDSAEVSAAEVLGSPSDTGLLVFEIFDTMPGNIDWPINEVILKPLYQPATGFSRTFQGESTTVRQIGLTRFVLRLDSSQYSFERFGRNYASAHTLASKSVPAGGELGTFQVYPNEITYLGTFVVNAQSVAKTPVYDIAILPGTSMTTAKDERVLPQVISLALGDQVEPHGWQTRRDESKNQQAWEDIKNGQTNFWPMVPVGEHGQLLAGGMLGRLHFRRGLNDWVVLDTKLNRPVRTIRVVDRNRAIVQTVSNRQYLFDTRNETVTPVDDRLPLLPLYDVWRQDKKINALYQDNDSLRIVELSSDLQSVFGQQTIPLPHGSVTLSSAVVDSGDNPEAVFFVQNRDAHRVGLLGTGDNKLDVPPAGEFRRQGDILTLDLAANIDRWRTRYALAKKYSENRVSFDGGSTWNGYEGKFKYPSVLVRSVNRIERARHADRLRLNRSAHFVDEDVAFATVLAGKKSFVAKTEDGGSNWSFVETPITTDCSTLLSVTKGQIVLFCERNGSFYVTTDRGVTWTLDRASEAG